MLNRARCQRHCESNDLVHRFANQLAEALDIPVLILDFAIDGTSILEWTDPRWIGRQNFDAALATVGGDVEILVWFQGGENILNDLPTTTYQSRLNTFYDQIQAQLPAARTLELFEAIQGRGDYPQPHDASYAAIRQASSYVRGDGHYTASQYQIMADRYIRAILHVLGTPGGPIVVRKGARVWLSFSRHHGCPGIAARAPSHTRVPDRS